MSRRREELAWAAGFFDGEGWVGTRPIHGRRVLGLNIKQVDRRVLDRFMAAVGLGHVNGPYASAGRVNPLYGYDANGYQTVQAIVAMLWNWLSPVKRAQALRAFATTKLSYSDAPGRRQDRDSCIRGHLFDDANTVRRPRGKYVIRHCRKCQSERSHALRMRRMMSVLLEAA